MPHLIIEYTPDVIADPQLSALVDAVYTATESSALFEAANIKVRAIPVTAYRLGMAGQGFVCVQCRIHAGRTEAQKKRLSEAVVAAVRQLELEPGVAVISAEVIEMDRTGYSKYVHD